jgi:hypothetical protein
MQKTRCDFVRLSLAKQEVLPPQLSNIHTISMLIFAPLLHRKRRGAQVVRCDPGLQ